MHGIYQIVGNITAKYRVMLWDKLGVSQQNPILVIAKKIGTFALVCIAWMAFRANSLRDLGFLYKQLFTGWSGVSITESMKALDMSVMALMTVVFSVFVINLLDKQINLRIDELHLDSGLSVPRANAYITVCWTVCVAWLILLASNAASSFIYFQF